MLILAPVLALILAGKIIALIELLSKDGRLCGVPHEFVEVLANFGVVVPA